MKPRPRPTCRPAASAHGGVLAGCGFHLQGRVPLPAGSRNIFICGTADS